jgi:hypothetical protein
VTSLSAVARHFLFVRETDGPNRGAFVELFQRFTGNSPGDSWCCSFESWVEDVAYRGHAPTPRTASCAYKLSQATAKGYVVSTPEIDDLYFFIESGVAHHVGIVTGISPLTGIAANTSPDGLSTNGIGVFEHEIHAHEIVFVRLPSA